MGELGVEVLLPRFGGCVVATSLATHPLIARDTAVTSTAWVIYFYYLSGLAYTSYRNNLAFLESLKTQCEQ